MVSTVDITDEDGIIKLPMIDFTDTQFLETSKTAAFANRLNWRAEILLSRNREVIEGKSVLDLASHDGRFSWACLELRASRVVGVEGRQELGLIQFSVSAFSITHCAKWNCLPL